MSSKSVGWDCRTGDEIILQYTAKVRRSGTVVDTYPHGIRLQFKDGRCFFFTYRELIEREAQYVKQREPQQPSSWSWIPEAGAWPDKLDQVIAWAEQFEGGDR